ncbi:rhodanese-like domain-containing protein [Virgisporangium ochraceum]|uniref:Sulfurtransferase n=2 Tax=Virgisporangium ochraceum TaxID=65505 RepID=A0A8J3ZNA0_9ACTN|nr:sulfurtransferase [Virgisporangium ochraceum]
MMVPTVDAAGVADDAYLLDVREPDEWAAGHPPGAHHVPMMQIPTRADEVPTDRDVVVVCRVGGRSAQVVAYLKQRGFDNVYNLDGGMFAWAAAGRPVVGEDGSAGHVI